ncbi:MAG: phenylacetic acid degradation operon negative regulatory protein PaaX, partial [Rhodoplanes sp.]
MISRLLKQIKPKAKSVIVTIYGDAITHHGGSAWLGSIIKLAAPLGLNERVVRTSVFRLAKEDWLVADQVGRRSYYRLTEAGRHRFDTAHSRIYHHASRPWDGHWTFVIIDFAALKGKNGEALRSDLRWQGFGQLTAGVMLHPDADKAALHQALVDADASKRALVMHAAAGTAAAPAAVRGLVERCWGLQRLAADYAAFLKTFRPVWQALHHAAHLDPETCFVVRTLLMHSYRRVLLRDPKLPDELLEANWPGASARLLCRNLYRLVQA